MVGIDIAQKEFLIQAGLPWLVSDVGELLVPARTQQRPVTQVQHPCSDRMTHVTRLHGEDWLAGER